MIFHPYWKLRFINRKNKPFFWSRGSTMGLVLTTRCQLKCSICQMFIPTGKRPQYDECTLIDLPEQRYHYPIDNRKPLLFYCEHKTECKFQSNRFHRGMMWGCVETYSEKSWLDFHKNCCGGKLIQVYEEKEV
jgi:hypothetical protein